MCLSRILTKLRMLCRRSKWRARILCGRCAGSSVCCARVATLTGNLQRARSYSERLFRGEEIDSLPPEEAVEAFLRPLEQTQRTSDRKLAEDVVAEVEGYPYFVQLWGSELWDAADLAGVERFTRPLLDATRLDIYARLDRDFYEPRIATLTPSEQDVLLASATCDYPPLRSAELVQHSDKTPGNVNVLLGRLVDEGALYRIGKGEYAYTAPRFRDYLNRRTDPTQRP